MILALRIVLSGLGLLYLVIGAGFLIDPGASGAAFGLQAAGPQGLAAIRADLTGFFCVLGACLIIGVWRGMKPLLGVAAALVGIAFVARALSAVIDGTYEQWFVPMIVEAVTVILALAAMRLRKRNTSPFRT